MKILKLVTIVVVVGLVLALLYVGTPIQSANAAEAIQYKAVPVSGSTESIQSVLDQYDNDGWELVAIEPLVGHLIFKK